MDDATTFVRTGTETLAIVDEGALPVDWMEIP